MRPLKFRASMTHTCCLLTNLFCFIFMSYQSATVLTANVPPTSLSPITFKSTPPSSQSKPILFQQQLPQVIMNSQFQQHQQQQQQQQQLQPQQLSLHQSQQQSLNKFNPYTKATNDILLDLRQQMLTRSIKFDELFRNLISSSKISLHNMFAKTYGVRYEQNTEIFTGMFENLEQYYANGQVQLTKSMKTFFEKLYQKIFQVTNLSRAFSAKYLECATEQLNHLKPFKDVPEKLTDEIRHTFVAARTFVHSLNNAIDIIKDIISLGQTPYCMNLIKDKLLKDAVIPPGSNQLPMVQKPPCLNFCEQVISRCIGRPNLESLNDKWKNFVQILGELAYKLSTSYNIESIIAPLDVQISEAIMNFQENAINISQQVFQVCGDPRIPSLKPISNRFVKRAANQAPFVPYNRQSAHYPIAPFNQPLASLAFNGQFRAANSRDALSGSVLSEDLTPISQNSPLLIDEIRKYMLSTKNFWFNLPNSVCMSNLTQFPGSNMTSNAKKQTNCHHEVLGISDLNLDMRYRSEIIQQVNRLDALHKKIEQALSGDEIEWTPIGADQRQTQSVFSPMSVPTRLPVTTTTVSPMEINIDEERTDEPEDEIGSGTDDLEGDITDPSDTTIDDYDGESETSTQSGKTEESESDLNPPTPENQPAPDSGIDDNGLITPIGPAGSFRSSQTSNQLVISSGSQLLLLVLVLSCSLYHVLHFTACDRYRTRIQR